MATLVKFRIHPVSGELFAFFPQLKYGFNGYRNDLKTCYAHIGQHSACAKEYEQESRAARPNEYNPLKSELESIGYNLKICK